MDIALLVIAAIIVGLLVFVVLKLISPQEKNIDTEKEDLKKERDLLIEERAFLKSDLEQKKEKVTTLEMQVKTESEEKVEFREKGRGLQNQYIEMREKLGSAELKTSDLQKSVTKYEEEKERKEADFKRGIEQIDTAQKKLREEQDRVRREDEQKLEQEKEERSRRWAEHENTVLTRLKDVCKQPNIQFEVYDNVNLPDTFDGGLKPDALVEIFPGEYIIFDAKFSENKVQTYFRDQVPKTVTKIKKSKSAAEIYPTVYFVVPNELLQEAKQLFRYEQGFSFYMISIESLAPIMASYKKITEYEFADHFDPKDRENIINTLAGYESFIMNQNAANILVAEKASEVVKSKDILGEALVEQIAIKRKNIKPMKLKDSEMKKLTHDIVEQEKKIKDLTSPKATIDKDDLDIVQENLL